MRGTHRAGQIAAAARRLARAIGQGNESRFIQIRMRRAGEVRAILMDTAWGVDPAVLARMQELIAYLDGPVALVPLDVPVVGGLDRALLVDMSMGALNCAWNASFAAAAPRYAPDGQVEIFRVS